MALARSGEEALDLLAAQPVDCVLLDLIMPGLGGETTCRQIKGAQGIREIPVILLTALEDHETMIRGLEAGADDYISKSSDFTVLKARVLAQIRRKQFEDETRQIREPLLQRDAEAAEARVARQLAETRAAFAEELRRKNAELETFSYSVSHDLRAPLRSIDGFSQALIEDHSSQLDEAGHAHLRRIRAAAHRMAQLIEDLINLSRIDRAEMVRAPVHLSAMAHRIVERLETSERGRPTTFVVQSGVFAQVDPHLIEIVLENLLGNAWKFTRKADMPRIEFGSVEENGMTTFFVKDNGARFDPAYAHKLFAPFQRLHTDKEFPGTGIGLATVRRIVERHGGRVWAEAAVGHGAVFRWTSSAEGKRDLS